MRQVFKIDPLRDDRWARLVARHPRSSIFHTAEWLSALQRTYGYEPISFTTSPPGRELESGLVFCEIESWLTGRRLVALPFSDHCEPLVNSAEELDVLILAAERHRVARASHYLELRTTASGAGVAHGRTSKNYLLHRLDLTPPVAEISSNLHRDCIQRKIRRATRDQIVCRDDRPDVLLASFYRLLVLTRRRHGLPPQPFSWFRNLIEVMGNRLNIAVAYKNDVPIAAILTLTHSGTIVYKYGCSDTRFNTSGATQLLLWRMILQAKQTGQAVIDFGRSDISAAGLIKFKERWGSSCTPLTYLRVGESRQPVHHAFTKPQWLGRAMRFSVEHAPTRVLSAASELIYRHAG